MRCAGRWRLSWAFLGGGLAAWSLGEFIWSYYEVFADTEVPFPSLADAGFLLFPVLCLIGLFLRPSTAFVGRARIRVLLDGTMVVASLFILSWATALGAVYHAGAQDTFSLVVSLAYPASDLMLITVVVLVASRVRLDAGLLLLAGGLAVHGRRRQRVRLPRRGRAPTARAPSPMSHGSPPSWPSAGRRCSRSTPRPPDRAGSRGRLPRLRCRTCCSSPAPRRCR